MFSTHEPREYHTSPPHPKIGLTCEHVMVSKLRACSPIPFKYVNLLCSFLDMHLANHHSLTIVYLRCLTELSHLSNEKWLDHGPLLQCLVFYDFACGGSLQWHNILQQLHIV